MAKRKSTKWHTTIYKTLHRKLKIDQHEHHSNSGELMCSEGVSSSCSTSGIRCVVPVANPVISHEYGEERKVFTTSEHIRGHLCHRYSIAVNQVKNYPKYRNFYVISVAIPCNGNHFVLRKSNNSNTMSKTYILNTNQSINQESNRKCDVTLESKCESKVKFNVYYVLL